MLPLSIVSDLIFYGFGLTTPLLSGLYWALPRQRPALLRLLAVSALLLLIASTASLSGGLVAGIRAFSSADESESYAWLNRISGPYWWAYWGLLAGQGLLPQVLWRRALRQRPGVLLLLVPGVFAGLAESLLLRYAAAQHRDYLPSSWAMTSPDELPLLVFVVVYLGVLLAIERATQSFRPAVLPN